METAIEQSNKIKITEDTKVAFVHKKKVYAEDLEKWIYRRLDAFPDLLAACKKLSTTISGDENDYPDSQLFRMTMDAVRQSVQAIAKAENK